MHEGDPDGAHDDVFRIPRLPRLPVQNPHPHPPLASQRAPPPPTGIELDLRRTLYGTPHRDSAGQSYHPARREYADDRRATTPPSLEAAAVLRSPSATAAADLFVPRYRGSPSSVPPPPHGFDIDPSDVRFRCYSNLPFLPVGAEDAGTTTTSYTASSAAAAEASATKPAPRLGDSRRRHRHPASAADEEPSPASDGEGGFDAAGRIPAAAPARRRAVALSMPPATTAASVARSLLRQHSAPSAAHRPYFGTLENPPANAAAGARPRVGRSLSRTQTIKNYIKKGTANFFGVHEDNEEDQRQKWEERRLRLAAKQYGKLREDFLQQLPAEEGLLVRTSLSRPLDGAFGDVVDGVPPPPPRRQVSHATDVTEPGSSIPGITRVHPVSRHTSVRRSKDSVAKLTWDGLTLLATTVARSRSTRRRSRTDRNSCSFRYPQPSVIEDNVFASLEGGSGVVAPAVPLPSTMAIGVPEAVDSFGLPFSEGSLVDDVFFEPPEPFFSSNRNESEVVGGISDAASVHINSEQPVAPTTWLPPEPVKMRSGWRRTDAVMPEIEMRRQGTPSVGMRRIWDRLLVQMFDNSNRRQYGMGVVGRVLRRSFRRERITSDVKEQLDDLDDHRPYFTYWVTTVQILITIMTLVVYGFGPIGFEQTEQSDLVLVPSLSHQQVDYFEPDNFWIGPRAADLVHLGAKFAPCMRWDSNVMKAIQRDRARERDTACCIRGDSSGCIQATRDDCSITISTWKKWTIESAGPGGRISGSVCGQDPDYCSDPPSVHPYSWPDDITKWPICKKRLRSELRRTEHMGCEVIGHPCCFGILGECQITTREYCNFLKGFFHEEAALCSQVSCLDDICGMIPFYKPDVPDQFYRLWTSLFLHAGLIHLAITLVMQYLLMRDLEKLIGPIRIGILYIVSGIAGNLASAIFVPYRAEVGPAGAQFGLLACLIVEVLHCWPLLRQPRKALGKLLAVIGGLFVVGLLPWVDNYAHIIGFGVGFLLSYALLPFVSFGKYDRRKKVILIWVCILSFVGLFAMLVLFFYVHPIYECEVCKYFTCIPFTPTFCATQDINITSRRRL